ncbi:MAG TPA: TolC family protein [Pirellulaceae bacterium]|nr:TolC family protein [Pirellulaceae bacterium]
MIFPSGFADLSQSDRFVSSQPRETYAAISEKADHPAWAIPPRPLETPPQSRLFDPFNPDRPPMPPDDPAAHRYMHVADGRSGSHRWHAQGDAASVESLHWLQYLELSDEGTLQLNPERSVELGLVHSREYQFELERLYLSALALTLERFQFDLQWFGSNVTRYDHFGTGGRPTESNTLTTASRLGFTRASTTGGQLLVDFANTMVWEFTGTNSQTTLSVLTASMVQPLLRGAFRDVRMEPLTQAERNVLYSSRDFARFRKVFYFNLVSVDDGYLQLLLRLQAIRNLEANLVSLEQNLLAHEALAVAGIVSQIQVDQVFQSYQSGRLQLIRAENDFATDLDAYKVRLGLPPDMPVRLDDSLLEPFRLSDADLEALAEEVEATLSDFRQLDEAPPIQRLAEGYAELRSANARLLPLLDQVEQEYQQWSQEEARRPPVEDERQRAREQLLRRQLGERLVEVRLELQRVGQGIGRGASVLAQQTPAASWQEVQRLARRLLMIVQDLAVLQTQVRVELIELPRVEFEQDQAIAIALNDRLDLMNRQARVVDAWRKIEIAADALESDLDLFAEANVVTQPGSNNPLNFSADASRYRVGVRFDGPLNRLGERNVYRAQLIEYQRTRREFIASRDGVVRAVRFDLRELDADRINFEITRQRLIVAARQVEEARLQLLAPGLAGDSSKTQDVLNALNSLLAAKDSLIGIWARYHSTRLRLLLDLELLELDPRGLDLNDNPNSAVEHINTPHPSPVLVQP